MLRDTGWLTMLDPFREKGIPVDLTDISALAAAYGYESTDAAEAPDTTVVDTVIRHGVDLDKMRELDRLQRERRQHQAQAEELGARISQLEAELLEQFSLSGQPDVAVDGRRGSPRRRIWGKRVGDVSDADYYAAFRDAGPEWAALVKPGINSHTLAAKITELADGGTADELERLLPPSIREVLTVTERWSIGFANIRRGGSDRPVPPSTARSGAGE